MNIETKDMLLTMLSGFFTCLILGIIIYGTNIFNNHDTRFQFVLLGLYGSMIYGVIKYKGPKELVFTAVIIIIIDLIRMGKDLTINQAVFDLFLIASIFVSMILYIAFINKNENIPLIIRALVLMLLFAVTNVSAIVLNIFVRSPGYNIMPLELLIYSRIPAAIGLGLGIGFDTYSLAKSKLVVDK